MKFEIGKYTDVTELAFEVNPEYKANNYIKVFVCFDIKDVWLVRVIEGINEEYEQQEGVFLIERDKIDNIIPTIFKETIVKKILAEDQFENWDVLECASMETVMEIIDGGW